MELKLPIDTPYPNYFPMHITKAQAWQDIFVIAMLEGKMNGTYLELGGFLPSLCSNTDALEKYFNFTGVTFESEIVYKPFWDIERPNSTVFFEKVEHFDFSDFPKYFDYLQVDIDTPLNGFNILKKLSHIEFAVITFEHDRWTKDPTNLEVMKESREYLLSLGYELVVNDVTIEPGRGYGISGEPIYFEDWYVNPKYVKRHVIDSYRWLDENVIKYGQDIMLKSRAYEYPC